MRDCGEGEGGRAKHRRYPRVYSLQPYFLPLVSIMCSVYAWDRWEGLAQSLPKRNMSVKDSKAEHRTNLTNYTNKYLAYYFSRAFYGVADLAENSTQPLDSLVRAGL